MANKNIAQLQNVALALQEKRADWKSKLEELPMPKANVRQFPYGSMEAAIADDFKLFDGGKEDAFRVLVKGWKTIEWRKAAESNRDKRDLLAEGKAAKKRAEAKVKKSETPSEQAQA